MSSQFQIKLTKSAVLAILVLALFGGAIIDAMNLIFGMSILYTVLVKGTILFSSLFLLLQHQLRNGKKYNKYALLLLVFFILYSVRLIIVFKIDHTVLGGHFRNYNSNQIITLAILGCFLPALSVGLTKERLDPIKLHKYFSLTAFGVSAAVLFGLLSNLSQVVGLLQQRAIVYQEGGALIGPLTVGGLGSLTFLIGLFSMFFKKLNLWFTVIMISNILVGLMLILMSGTRSFLITSIICSFLMFMRFMKFNRFRVLYMTLLMLGIGVFSWVSIKMGLLDDLILLERLSDVGQDTSTTTRLQLWKYGINQSFKYPVFGNSIFIEGYGYPHNLMVETVMSTGFTGLLLLLSVLTPVLLNIINKLYYSSYNTILPLFFVTLFLYSMFSGAIYNSVSLWVTIMYITRI